MTIKEWLQEVANTNTSSEQDSIRMENLLRKMGFPEARVVIGIVYPEGHGQPLDIHSMARTLLKAA